MRLVDPTTRLFPAVAAILALLTIPVGANAQTADLIRRHQDMLTPVVKVRAGQKSGSGTVIFSGRRTGSECETYVLTNHHVLAGALTPGDLTSNPIAVVFYDYEEFAFVGTTERVAHVVATDAVTDLGLLKLAETRQCAARVARMLPEDGRLYVGEDIWAVGAGDGWAPFITYGVLGATHQSRDRAPRIFSTAPLIEGSSGGALFHRTADGQYEMIGVPYAMELACCSGGILTTGSPSEYPIPHLAWSVRMDSVRAFLRANGFEFIMRVHPAASSELNDPDHHG